jgi:hypothetical protein
MFRRLFTAIRRPWRPLLAMVALAALAAAIPRGHEAPAAPTLPDPTVDPRTDAGTTTWPVQPMPAPAAEPAPERVARPAEEPSVDWESLAHGVADIGVAHASTRPDPAGPTHALTASEARAILAEAEDLATDRRAAPGVGVVIGRGTPSGGSDGGICKLKR